MKIQCPHKCHLKESKKKSNISKKGFFLRKSDSKKIQRYSCSLCKHGFSQATFSLCYKQKKRKVNPVLYKLLSSGISMRKAALILNLNRITVKRKSDFLKKMKQKNLL